MTKRVAKGPKLPHRYSGKLSESFWARVNAIDHAAYHDAAYMLGVSLQDLEERALQFIENAEKLLADRARERGGK